MYHTSDLSQMLELRAKSKDFEVGSFNNKKNDVNKLLFSPDGYFVRIYFLLIIDPTSC